MLALSILAKSVKAFWHVGCLHKDLDTNVNAGKTPYRNTVLCVGSVQGNDAMET